MVGFVECSFQVMFQTQPSINVTGQKEVNSLSRLWCGGGVGGGVGHNF